MTRQREDLYRWETKVWSCERYHSMRRSARGRVRSVSSLRSNRRSVDPDRDREREEWVDRIVSGRFTLTTRPFESTRKIFFRASSADKPSRSIATTNKSDIPIDAWITNRNSMNARVRTPLYSLRPHRRIRRHCLTISFRWFSTMSRCPLPQHWPCLGYHRWMYSIHHDIFPTGEKRCGSEIRFNRRPECLFDFWWRKLTAKSSNWIKHCWPNLLESRARSNSIGEEEPSTDLFTTALMNSSKKSSYSFPVTRLCLKPK